MSRESYDSAGIKVDENSMDQGMGHTTQRKAGKKFRLQNVRTALHKESLTEGISKWGDP